MGLIQRLLPDSVVEKKYVRAGAIFRDAASYLYMGECIGFERLLTTWAEYEEQYAQRGFRTVSLDRFVGLGGYGRKIDDVLRQKRDAGEEVIFHARIYREQFLGKVAPVIDINKVFSTGEAQVGHYAFPSTESGE